MIGSRVFIVKEREEWSNFAEFVGTMVAKYADKMDFESLSNPDLYLLKRDMLDWYKAYNRARQKKEYFDVEYVKQAICNGWSSNILELQIQGGLYERTGGTVNNFDVSLPKNDSDMARDIEAPRMFVEHCSTKDVGDLQRKRRIST